MSFTSHLPVTLAQLSIKLPTCGEGKEDENGAGMGFRLRGQAQGKTQWTGAKDLVLWQEKAACGFGSLFVLGTWHPDLSFFFLI